MKKVSKIAALAVLMLGMAAMLQPANAICSSPRLISSGSSYVITPGCEAGGCGSQNSTVTDDATGVFWAIGDGNDALTVGQDNGDFPFLGGWGYIYSGYPALINSTWAADPGIDGCIDFAPDPRCMAILIMDNDANSGAGAFALLTDEPDALNNYSFQQDGNINLVSLGGMSITGSARVPDGTSVDITVNGVSLTDVDAGLYLDPACPQPSGGGPGGIIAGYQVFSQETDRGVAPLDNNVDNWTAVGPVVPLGAPSTVTVTCVGDPAVDKYIAAGLVFESGFGNTRLSGNSTRLECGANLADPEALIERKPRSRQLRRGRSLGR